MYPSLKDILNGFQSIEELRQWATQNRLLDHPFVRERLCSHTNLSDILNQFNNAEDLTQWAIHNLLINNQQILDKLDSLLTCSLCGTRLLSTEELRKHEETNHYTSQPGYSLSCSWCKLKLNSHNEHEEFQRLLDDCVYNSVETMTSHSFKQKAASDFVVYGSEETTPVVQQIGTGDDEEEPYVFRQTGQKTFSKNLAKETTYKIKFTDEWKGKKIRDLITDIRHMFDDVLTRVKGGDQDLGRVVLKHPELNHPVVVPLDKWSHINSDTVMDAIERVLNSEENLPLDEHMEVVIGNISVPKGSGRVHVTKLEGPQSSVALKRSMMRISNNDHLCMATAIGLCFNKLCKVVSLEEWTRLTKDDSPDCNVTTKVIKHRASTISYLAHLKKSDNNKYRTTMAQTLCRLADLPTDRPLGLTDIHAFEELLDVNVLVLSSRCGNTFCRVANDPLRKNIYLYLTENDDDDDDDHFDSISSINGFFNYGYFCETCLKPYKNKGKHSCTTSCDVCGSNDCPEENDPMSCRSCNRTCRSRACFQRHGAKTDMRGRDIEKSMCDRLYQCKICRKVIDKSQRKPEEHMCGEWKCTNCFQYQMGRHLCYQRKPSRNPKTVPRKYFFYDFETTQNERMNCNEGYVPGEPCRDKCTMDRMCNKCRTCVNCNESWCGLQEHKVNFAILQSTCDRCKDEELKEESRCLTCGSRCDKCREFKKNVSVLPCEDSCGYRQRVFEGCDVPAEFCSHVMTRHYRNTVLIAHNAKGFDNYPVLNALISRHGVRPNKILYSGSKIMYMHVAHGLDLTFLDSLNFIGMKLSKIPECFDLAELQKGYFPHLFNTTENQDYVGRYPDPDYYGIEYMSAKERKKFLEWHESKQDHTFDFRKEIKDYCVSDVDILRRGCMKFRETMMAVTSKSEDSPGIDPFDHVTIASACQAIYRELFLEEQYETYVTDNWTEETSKRPTKFEQAKEKTVQMPDGEWYNVDDVDRTRYSIGKTVFAKSAIAIVPSEGYNTDSFSKASIQWLEWKMEHHERRTGRRTLKIQHALSGGEHKVPGTRYRLDGYDEETKTAYEYHGELLIHPFLCNPPQGVGVAIYAYCL